MNTRSLLAALLLPILLSAPAGCVQQRQYDDLLTAYRSQEQQVLACQAELESSRANENALRNQLARAAEDLRALENFRSGQGQDLDRLLADYEALLRQLDDLRIGPLPEQVSSELAALAQMHPDLIAFDEKRGMLRFNADFTFDLGEATLKPGASRLIPRLAQILNSTDARPFEVKVVGHTDSVPIRRPQTLAKHPTNVHLSAHRAISVRDALVNAGVSPGRVQVAGFGEFRPIVPNGPQGAAENRRVEVFLTLATGSFDAPAAIGGAPAPARPARPAPQPVDDEPLK